MNVLSTLSGDQWLPVIFLGLMAVAVLAYVVLDGYDLGVGLLTRFATDEEKDVMIASIGPFWDANETWLVLGIGILLVAFPLAHGVILTALYLPVMLMLAGLILRGVAFDFRVKVLAHHKPLWNFAFHAGSLLAAFAQGVMLGRYILGFADGFVPWLFAFFCGIALPAGYTLLGAGWLIVKTEGDLQRRAIVWARRSLWLTGAGIAAVSVVTPLVSMRIYEKWFALPELVLLLPVPLTTGLLFFIASWSLQRLPTRLETADERGAWIPFASAIGMFLLAFFGLGYSMFPYLVVDRIDLWQAASAPESLKIVLIGVLVVLPAIVAYTVYAYRVFRGKAQELTYY